MINKLILNLPNLDVRLENIEFGNKFLHTFHLFSDLLPRSVVARI
uniref:Uncharacterized protein n=1 Tax=Rhizophora mucronata TaxID=61149 RepID=A0A2P2QWK4_RHIMU